MARRRYRIPGLQVPSNTDGELLAFFNAVKERLELLSGERGDPNERAVSLSEIRDVELAGITTKNSQSRLTRRPPTTTNRPGGAGGPPELDFSVLPVVPLANANGNFRVLLQGAQVTDRFAFTVGDLLTIFGRLDQESAPQFPWSFEGEEYGFDILSPSPRFRMTEEANDDGEADFGEDEAGWEFGVDNGVFTLSGLDDDGEPTPILKVVRSGAGAQSIYSFEGGVETLRHSLANPTTQIGLTAVNGVSLQPMRSDAAPALNQGIAPTWTSRHIFAFAGGTQLLTGTTAVNANPISGDPEHLVDIVNDGTAYQVIRVSSYGDTVFQNNVHWMRARGTLAEPEAVEDGDIFMSFGFRGFDGTDVTQSAAAYAVSAAENWAPGAHGIYFSWDITPVGSDSRYEAMRLRNSGLQTDLVLFPSSPGVATRIIGNGSDTGGGLDLLAEPEAGTHIVMFGSTHASLPGQIYYNGSRHIFRNLDLTTTHIFDADGVFWILDGVTAPVASVSGMAGLYIDSADGDPKIRFADGVVKIISTDLSGVQSEELTGAVDDLALDAEIGFLDIDTSDGAATITGIVAQRDGQIIVVSCVGSNPLTIAALDSGSSAGNQIRASSDLTLLQWDSLTLRYSAQIEKWVVIS